MFNHRSIVQYFERDAAAVAQSISAFAPQAEGSVFESQPRQTKVVKTGPVTAPLPNARQWVWVSRVLGKDHYKWMSRFTVDVARLRTLTAQWPRVPSIGQNLQPFTGNIDISIWVKNSQVGRKTTNKQTNK